MSRFAADYRRYLDQGKPQFDPYVWYRVQPGPDWTVLVSILVGVSVPVRGLGPYLSRLVSDVALESEGMLAFRTAVRLHHDIDEKHMKGSGWESLGLPLEWPEPDFDIMPEEQGEQTEFVTNR